MCSAGSPSFNIWIKIMFVFLIFLSYLFGKSHLCSKMCINRSTNFMELRPRVAASYTATHEPPSIFGNSKVHCRVHKSPLLVWPVWSLSRAYHPIPTLEDPSAHILLGLPSGLFLSCFPSNNLYTFLSPFLIRAIYPAHINLNDLAILIILGDEYKLWRSSFCSFL
jgi:hypothetical protein